MNNNLLGKKIREIRKKSGKSITETATSIDVGRSYLSRLENGYEKVPSQKVIRNLIDHFSLSKSEEAELLWLASHFQESKVKTERKEVSKVGENKTQKTDQENRLQINIPDNMQVLYSDSVWVTSSRWGIVLDFAQSVGPTNRQNVVSRVGMSKEHAQAMFDVLKKKLKKTKKTKK